MSRLLPTLLCLLLAAPLAAQERILSYDSTVEVAADGGLEVTERIAVRAEGNQIRRGIYRDYPTRYKDRHGNRVVVGFEVLEVLRDGRIEPWFTEKMSNGVRVNTGNDDLLPVPAQYTYTLRYRTTRQLGFFPDHDELYWNAIGTGWAFAIERGSVEVRLPQAVPVDRLRAEGYTGAQGTQGTAFVAETPSPGSARWRLTQPLAPQEGFTIVLSFPKGLIPAPTLAQRTLWLLQDNRGVLVALTGLIGLLVFCLRRWRRLGRDPRPGVIIARYDPPPGHSPAGLRYLRRMKYDARCFSSDLLAMAVDGQLRIHRKKGFLKDDWKLERITGRGAATLTEPEKALLGRLFADGLKLALRNTNARIVSGAQSAHQGIAGTLPTGTVQTQRRQYRHRFRHRAGQHGIGFHAQRRCRRIAHPRHHGADAGDPGDLRRVGEGAYARWPQTARRNRGAQALPRRRRARRTGADAGPGCAARARCEAL